PPGVDSWVRTFTVEWVERPLPRARITEAPGGWQVFAPDGYPLADQLRERFAACGGHGVVACLPPGMDERHIGLLLEAAHAALAERDNARFVLVQHGGGG